MAQFSKEEVFFVKELPEHVEIECPVCLNILTDPHIVSCCGHNFCRSCIERVKASNGSCPMCKENEYQVVVNKERLRIINGLEVYCSNKEKGCQWKGELKNMSTHIRKEMRKGDCEYEEVKCRYTNCRRVRMQRRYLKDHEDSKCPQRPFQCPYCAKEGTFLSITMDHYIHPVTDSEYLSTMPQGSLTAHVNHQCPLEPVDCVFSWAGCNDKPLRKDVHVHTADTKHMTLLAVACGQLKKENEQIKEETTKEIAIIKEEIVKLKKDGEKIKEDMKIENDKIKHEIVDTCNAIGSPLLPIDIKLGEAVHFYTSRCGRHMSARLMKGNHPHSLFVTVRIYILFAFLKGKFKPKLPKIFFKYKGKDIPLPVDTEATYQEFSDYNILNTISNCEGTLPQGVFKIELDQIPLITLDKVTVTICTQ
uniref:RING-type domain-containing protein n=1 Tax=Amphimedon queenslandica TaxID=400682 RepID=A0A1X7UHG1_AMPQE